MKNILFLFLLLSATSYALDASYKGDSLIMTERRITSNEYKLTYDLSIPLSTIYWNPSNNQYYHVKDGSDLIKTNGLTYKLDPKKEEKNFVEDIKDPYLQFAGYLSPNQRLYIDKRNKQQYIKSLTPINDPFEVVPTIVSYDDGRYMYTDYLYAQDQESFGRRPKTGNLTLSYLP